MKSLKDIYHMHIEPSSKKFYHLPPINYNTYTNMSTNMSKSMNDSIIHARGIQIDLAEDDFDRLQADIASYQSNVNEKSTYNSNYLSNIYLNNLREERIRQRNPTVAIAYEKYQSLLNLVNSAYD